MIGSSNLKKYNGGDKLPSKVMSSIETYTLQGRVEKREGFLYKRWMGYYKDIGSFVSFKDMAECIYYGD